MQTDVGFVQMPARTVDEAARLVEWVDSQKKNAYFALATFKEEHLNENGKRRVARKRKNVDRLKALWVDIDYKSCPQPDQSGALIAIRDFLEATGFPKPTCVVSSGNGLHLYWPFKAPVLYDEWHPLATAFKKLCQDHSLPADHACTADSARVLRPIDTSNWKDVSSPKPVQYIGGTGDAYELSELVLRAGGQSTDRLGDRRNDADIPEHIRRAVSAGSGTNGGGTGREYTAKPERAQNVKQVFKCGVFKHILQTKGAEQDEPEWNATLMVLAHLDRGRELAHAMSSGHLSYDKTATDEKFDQKLEAVEGGSGPTLCSTFEAYHEDICKACPFYKSKKVKTPKSLAYIEADPTPAPSKSAAPQLQPVMQFQQGQFPKGWRIDGNGHGIEHKIWNANDKDWEWVPVLHQVWELRKATRNIREKDCYLTLFNEHRGDQVEIPMAGELLGTTNKLTEILARYGAPIVDSTELKYFKRLMSTWLAELRRTNCVEDTTDQLGWIDEVEDEESKTLGFATGSHAYYCDGTERSGVVAANSKHKGIVKSFEPVGTIDPWREAVELVTRQGCDHLIMMLATAFAAPLVRYTGQNGAVLSLMSEDSGAGKSTGMTLAQSVWGDPRNAPATIQDTPTVVKNKIAYLQNITAYWDEVRGNDEVMNNFVQIAFQVSQGRDRERANSAAETIRAQTWRTMLVTASNDSLFDIAAGKMGESDAGVYRIFEIKVTKQDFPEHDADIMSVVRQLDTNYGHAGKVYARWLTDNLDQVVCDTAAYRLLVEKQIGTKGPERFWVATITATVMGAKFANAAGLTNIDTKRLHWFMINGLYALRARTLDNRTQLSPKELVAAYMQHHQDGKVVVDFFPTKGGDRTLTPTLQGNHQGVRKVSYVIAKDQNLMRVSKSDFVRWLKTSKNLRWSDKLQLDFKEEVDMAESKAVLAVGTPFALNRAQCLTFNVDMSDKEEDDNAE